jgi:tetratricopeptide (TPR) repeat protein
MLFYFGGRYDEAVAQLRNTIGMAPDFAEAHSTLFRVRLEQHKLGEARAELDRAHVLVGQTAPGLADAQLAAVEGQAEIARKQLAACERMAARQYISPGSVACVYAALGDKDGAFRTLNRAFEERDGMLAYARIFPAFAPLRSDLRFAALLRRVNLPAER